MVNKKNINSRIWNCSYCDEKFESRNLLQKHKKEKHNSQKNKRPIINGKCQFCSKNFKYQSGLTLHEKHCYQNPNRIPGSSHPIDNKTRKNYLKKQLIDYKEHIVIG